jgi:neutral ceramidase
MIRCGMSETDITPQLGLPIPGYLNARFADGIKDNLYAKAAVFRRDDETAALISIDALDFEAEDVKRIRERVYEITKIPEQNVMVCLTHTHTGGPVVNCFETKRDEAYISFLIEKAAEAVASADSKLKPVKLGFGKGKAENIAFNRRYVMKDGSVKTNPGRKNPNVQKPAGPVDPDLTMMIITDTDDRPLGAVVNFACHLDTVGGNEFCADYPGELSRILKAVYGKDFCTLFLNGFSGNINHLDIHAESKPDPYHYKKMGAVLAGEVIKTRPFIQCREDVSVKVKSKILPIPLRTVSEDEYQKAKELLASEDTPAIEKVFAEELLVFSQYKTKEIPVEIQVIQIGDAFITGFPGDIFTEFGLRIKEEKPGFVHFLSSHTNGRHGYIPVKEAFAQGGYEVRTTRSSKLAHEAGDIMTAAAIELFSS